MLVKNAAENISVSNDNWSQITDSISRIADFLDRISQPLLKALEEPATSLEENIPIESILSKSPIASLLQDESINDILINGPSEIYIANNDGLQKTDITFPNHNSLRKFAEAIANAAGRPMDEKRPLVDTRLRDGSRVNIIAPPMAVSGLSISIRKFPKHEITLDKLVEKNEMSLQMTHFLELCAKCRVSLLISGGTGTGKTTLLNAISHYIPSGERIITIEDTVELRLQQAHVVKLETKQPSIIGARQEEVNASDLVRNALRMRPDRILVGEVRGEEAYDMIQALNTGHDGSMGTIHANNPRDAFTRLENLIGPRMQNTPAVGIRRQIASALNFVVQLLYDQQGRRVVSSITEIVGMEADIPTMQEIFTLKKGEEATNASYTQLWTGIIPHHPKLRSLMHSDPMFFVEPKIDKLS